MDVDSITKIKEEIDTLKASQAELFEAGYQEGWKKTASMVILTLLILLGMTGVMEVLYNGLGWLSAIFIALGAVGLYRGIESDKATRSFRERYQENRIKLYALEEKYQEITFVPKTPEQTERDWREMMQEVGGESRPEK